MYQPFFARGILALCIFLSGYGPIAAQARDADSLLPPASLPDLIRYAIRRQPLVQQSLVNEQITELQIKSRLADWYPQLNFNYVYQHNFQVQTSIIGGNVVRLGVGNTSAFQLGATQAIFNRDLLLAQRTATDVRNLARQQTGATKIDLAADVSKAYYDVLATEQQLKVTAENIVRLERSLKDAKAQFDAGITDKTDYKRATIALNNSIASRKANEAALDAKTEYLKALINYPRQETLQIVYDSLALERDAVLDTLQPADYANRIEYRILSTQRRLQETNIRYTRWSYLPTVNANAAYNLNYLSNDFAKLYGQSFPNSFVGITLGVPIFQGGKRRYATRLAEWQLKDIDLQIEQFENNVHAAFNNALAAYKASLATYLALKENVLLAQEVYQVINLQYRSGIKTYLEVIAAETDLRTSRINYFNALYQLLSSKIDVQVSKGELIY